MWVIRVRHGGLEEGARSPLQRPDTVKIEQLVKKEEEEEKKRRRKRKKKKKKTEEKEEE